MATEYKTLKEKISAEKAERLERYRKFEEAWAEAVTAGNIAARDCVPDTMVVTDGTNTWHVDEGVCGFAEVVVPKGNTSFAHWAKKNAGFDTRYGGGLSHWVSAFGQSMERKQAFARAAAEVLNNHGIDAFATSRMD